MSILFFNKWISNVTKYSRYVDKIVAFKENDKKDVAIKKQDAKLKKKGIECHHMINLLINLMPLITI